MKKALLVIAAIIVIFILIFWGRINNSITVYSLVSDVTQLISGENDSYTLYIKGNINVSEKRDSLTAAFSYKRGNHFFTDVVYNDSRYSIISQSDSTQVFIGSAEYNEKEGYSIASQEEAKKKNSDESDLIVRGKGNDDTEFDIINLLGKILNNYPQTNIIPSLSWYEKTAISIWSFLYMSFDEGKKEGQNYQLISIPLGSKKLQLWINDEDRNTFYLTSNDKETTIDVKLILNQPFLVYPFFILINSSAILRHFVLLRYSSSLY